MASRVCLNSQFKGLGLRRNVAVAEGSNSALLTHSRLTQGGNSGPSLQIVAKKGGKRKAKKDRGVTSKAVSTEELDTQLDPSAKLDSLQAELLKQFEQRKKLHERLLSKLEAESKEHTFEERKRLHAKLLDKLENNAQKKDAKVDVPFKTTPPPRPSPPPRASPPPPPKQRPAAPSPAFKNIAPPPPPPVIEEVPLPETVAPPASAPLPKIPDLEPPSLGVSPPSASTKVISDATPKFEAAAGAVAEVSPPVEEEPPLCGESFTNLVFVASECAPWSKTGGLGDVVGALPKALAKRGHRVMVCVPRYANYPEAIDTGIRWQFPVFGGDQEVGYFHAFLDGVDYVFIDHGCFHAVSESIYAGEAQQQNFRFALLARAALESVWHVPFGGFNYGDDNTVFIANDWQTSLLPVYLQAYYRDHGQMLGSRSIMVIHNMAHQGRGPMKLLDDLAIPENYEDLFELDDPFGGIGLNQLQAGLTCAHRLVAVSHGYAWEIQTDMGGWGLAPMLRDCSWKIRGIVNGIDYDEWNPETDEYLTDDGYSHYEPDKNGIKDGKAKCKAALQKELGLPVEPDTPILGFIGRLDQQKGVDQIFESVPWLMGQNVQLVLLGSGRADLEDRMRQVESGNPDRVRAWVGFSVKMAHRINAAVDILLMPSLFEPCGLNQLYAQRYGTVPVVHAVGGLRDTVENYNPFEGTGTGWSYDEADKERLIETMGHAINTYRDHRDAFVDIQLRGMAKDMTWDHAAELYEAAIVDAKFDDYRG